MSIKLLLTTTAKEKPKGLLLISSVLKEWGIASDYVEELSAASQLAGKNYELILVALDSTIDPTTAVQHIKSLDGGHYKSTPLIAVVERANNFLPAQHGMDDVLPLPIDTKHFQSLLRKHIRQHRPLFIDFEMYTENDAAFKREFVMLIIDNLEELAAALVESKTQENSTALRSVFHKVKTSIDMLADEEFSKLTEEVRKMLNVAPSDGIFREKAAALVQLCTAIKESLHDCLAEN